MRTFHGVEELEAAVGENLGVSDWVLIDQERIDRFAEATGDHQWIHVDPVAAAEGPFGRTIAHGFLTLSLLPVIWHQLYTVDGVRMAVNYGLGKVRFLAPVLSDSRVRGSSTVLEVTRPSSSAQLTLSTTIEIEGQDKPAAVVESIIRYVL